MKNPPEYKNSAFQPTYARILDWGNSIGLIVLIFTFFLYISGTTQALIPLEKLPEYWTLSLSQYLEKTGAPTGWDWIYNLGKSEYQTYLGIVVLAGITFICYGTMLVFFLKSRKRIIGMLIFAELVLLLIASSNIIQTS